MKTSIIDMTLLADAVAELIENLHQRYPGIKTKTISQIEDEDFTIEVTIPPALTAEEVETGCQEECIRLEDKYDVYILPLVSPKAA